MFHPLFRLVIRRPGLLATHLLGYYDLARAQTQDVAAELLARLLWGTLLVICLGVGGGMTGVALLLWAVIPVAQMPMPWMLVVVPGVPLAMAFGCYLRVRGRGPIAMLEPIRDQLATDIDLLNQAERA